MAVTQPLAPAVNRAVGILDLVAAEPLPIGISEIARRLRLPKSSVSNLCGALVETGMLRSRSDGYGLGQHLAQLGASYLAGVDHVQLFHDSCGTLAVARHDTVQLAMLADGLEVVYLARRDGVHPVRLASTLGRSLPATCTATGKAILAELAPADLDVRLSGRTLTSMTAHSITSIEALRVELDEIRTSGRALDREEVVEGVVCVAVTIPGSSASGQWLAVSATLLAPQATPEHLDEIAGDLRVVASAISAGLGRPAASGRAPR